MNPIAEPECSMSGGNIWSLDKDQSIKHVLLLLVEQLGQDAFSIEDRIETDRCAIYLRQFIKLSATLQRIALFVEPS